MPKPHRLTDLILDIIYRYKAETGNWIPMISLPTNDYLRLAHEMGIKHLHALIRPLMLPISFSNAQALQETSVVDVQVGPSFNIQIDPRFEVVILEARNARL